MKAYRYEVKVRPDENAEPEDVVPQERLYIPGEGVFGYTTYSRSIGKINFFQNYPKIIEEAEQVIKGNNEVGRYLGEIELPDNIVLHAIQNGKFFLEEQKICEKRVEEARKSFEGPAERLLKSIDDAVIQ